MSPLHLSRNFSLIKAWNLSRERLPSLNALMPALPEEKITINALRALPITGKSEYRARAEEWLEVNSELPDFLIRSGGTTGEPALQWGYQPSYRKPSSNLEKQEKLRPLYLKAGDGRQGSVPHFPKDEDSLVIPLRDIEGYRIMTEILARKFHFAGYEQQFSMLAIPLPAAKKLVHYMLQRGISSDGFGVREVHTSSSYVSTPWRRLIESTLGARLIDHYGFTEIPAARAHECPGCSNYHFCDLVYPEIVGSDGGALSEPGAVGRLLVTRLLREADRAMPVVRFDSGDIVEVGEYCSRAGEAGFKPWGKFSHSISIERHGMDTLFPVRYGDVQEAIDSDPLVARIANVRHSLVTPSEGDAFPKWRIRPVGSDPRERTLEVEMSFEARLFPQAWQQFEQTFKRNLDLNNSHFGRSIREAQFRLNVVALSPGALCDADVMKC